MTALDRHKFHCFLRGDERLRRHCSPWASAQNHLAALTVALLGFFPFDCHLCGERREGHRGYGTGLADLSDADILGGVELDRPVLLWVAREYCRGRVQFLGS